VVSSDLIPFTGNVGHIRLSGVVHVVSTVSLLISSDYADPLIAVKVSAYLVPSDITAVDRQGNEYLAHGAGTATIRFHPDQEAPYYFPPMPGFVFVGSGAGVGGGSLVNNAFAVRLHINVLPSGDLDAIHSEAEAIDLQPHSSLR
jgi:hypothetical protein